MCDAKITDVIRLEILGINNKNLYSMIEEAASELYELGRIPYDLDESSKVHVLTAFNDGIVSDHKKYIKNYGAIALSQIDTQKLDFNRMLYKDDKKSEAIANICKAFDGIGKLGNICLFSLAFDDNQKYEGIKFDYLGVRSYYRKAELSRLMKDDSELSHRLKEIGIDLEKEFKTCKKHVKQFKYYSEIMYKLAQYIKLPKKTFANSLDDKDMHNLRTNYPFMFYESTKKEDVSEEIYSITASKPQECENTYIDEDMLMEIERKLVFSMIDFDKLKKDLKSIVISQEKAIDELVDNLLTISLDTADKNAPKNFMFIGPTGVGKNYMLETTKELLQKQLKIKIPFQEVQCSTFVSQGSSQTLTGSPKGYVGYGKDPLLTKFYYEISDLPISVLLFDEYEKGHKQLENILLHILDKGKITDTENNVLNFTRTIIAFTTNLGYSNLRKKSYSLGFSNDSDKKETDTRTSKVADDIRKFFSPEFINRVNLVHFNYLDRESAEQIFDLELDKVIKRYDKFNLEITIEQDAKQMLVDKGFNKEYGARHIKSVINKDINIPLSRKISADSKIDRDEVKSMLEIVRDLLDDGKKYEQKKLLNELNRRASHKLDYDKVMIKRSGDNLYFYVPHKIILS